MVADIKTFTYILGRMRTGKLVQKARSDETHRRPTGYQGSMCWMVIVYDEKMHTQGRSPAVFQQPSKPSGPLQTFHIFLKYLLEDLQVILAYFHVQHGFE